MDGLHLGKLLLDSLVVAWQPAKTSQSIRGLVHVPALDQETRRFRQQEHPHD